MFFEMRFDLGTLDSGERSLTLGLLVYVNYPEFTRDRDQVELSPILVYIQILQNLDKGSR